MTIHFGLEFDYPVFPESSAGTWQLGPKGLLKLLELHFGLSGHSNNIQHLRIEQYRQALLNYAQLKSGDVFYQASLNTDQLAAAATLLDMRDELVLAGWDFSNSQESPRRLNTLSDIEQLIREDASLQLSSGFADRFIILLDCIDHHPLPFSEIICNEPDECFPGHVKSLLEKLERKGIFRSSFEHPKVEGDNDLTTFKKVLLRQISSQRKPSLTNDGSLLILKAKRDTQAAEFIAQLLRLNPELRPLCLIPEKNRVLDIALVQEGLPSLGIASATMARPILQILKLVTAFLWNPLDPFKILEFVSLSVKPLARDLAAQIAMQMAQTPGINSANWYGMIEGYFDQLGKRAEAGENIDPKAIRRQYDFWFNRRRYNINTSVPKTDVLDLFKELVRWTKTELSGPNNSSLSVLKEQASRIVDFLEALPPQEDSLSYLELERIVRTIYEATPYTFKEKEVGHLPYIHHNAAITQDVNQLLWWNFSRNEYEHFFSRWYKAELEYLSKKGVHPVSPQQKNDILLWQRPRPILFTQEKLILVIPEMVDGAEVFSHPLFEEMEAGLSGIQQITYNLSDESTAANFAKHFKLPGKQNLPLQQIGMKQAFLTVRSPEDLAPRENETLTSLENLFYYPYQWVFRHKLRLRKSSILSVIADNTLKGNLAHRIFEELLEKKEIYKWGKTEIYGWIDENMMRFLRREGAVLLMYGREPERYDFTSRVKYAALSLISAIQKNGWRVAATEKDLNGIFIDLPVKGKADLILKRDDEYLIVDLKWRGASFRERMLGNEEDLQLVMYTELLDTENSKIHTAYFIIENGKIIARNNLALKEAIAVQPKLDHVEVCAQILDRMKKTYLWRRAQLDQGLIEIRTPQTFHDLELAYEGELMHLLEMKNEAARFDDYGVLIGLVD